MPEKWFAIDSAGVLKKLATDPARGLTRAEAERRLAESGPNRLVEVPVLISLVNAALYFQRRFF